MLSFLIWNGVGLGKKKINLSVEWVAALTEQTGKNFLPSFTHFTTILLGSQCLSALAFSTLLSVGKSFERTLFFYIGKFKTIVTLCVKNVQRNL